MKKVLVTGATGFVGRASLEPLRAAGFEVHAVTSRPLDSLDSGEGIRWHRADLLDHRQLKNVVQTVSATHLLHFAWFVEPGKYWTSLENYAWVSASLDLFRAFAEHGGQRIVGTGTSAEYDWDAGVCDEFETPLKPRLPYGECKHALRLLLESFAGRTSLSAAWGRLFFLYGTGEAPQRLVPSVVDALNRGEAARCSSGEQQRDFLHIQDVAEAFVALLDSEVQGPVNIASGNAVAIRDIVLTLGRLMGRPDLIDLGAIPTAASEPPLLVAKVERLRDEVGWTPRISLESGLLRTIQERSGR